MKTLATYQQEARRKFRNHFHEVETRFDVGAGSGSDEGQKEIDKFINDLISRTFSEIEKEAVPLGVDDDYGGEDMDAWKKRERIVGYNTCRADILERLARIRGDEKRYGDKKCCDKCWDYDATRADQLCHDTNCPCHSSPSEEKV